MRGGWLYVGRMRRGVAPTPRQFEAAGFARTGTSEEVRHAHYKK